jgi:hypothetical protein
VTGTKVEPKLGKRMFIFKQKSVIFGRTSGSQDDSNGFVIGTFT